VGESNVSPTRTSYLHRRGGLDDGDNVEGLLSALDRAHQMLFDVTVVVRDQFDRVGRDDDTLRRVQLEDLDEHIESHGAVRVIHEDLGKQPCHLAATADFGNRSKLDSHPGNQPKV